MSNGTQKVFQQPGLNVRFSFTVMFVPAGALYVSEFSSSTMVLSV